MFYGGMGIAMISALRLYQAELMQEIFMTQDKSVAYTDEQDHRHGRPPGGGSLPNRKVQQTPVVEDKEYDEDRPDTEVGD